MIKPLAFARLDFITIKPYLTVKNLIIFAMVAAAINLYMGGSASIGIIMAYATVYVSYPFALGEKNGVDMLYSTLSISRGNVVAGRYIFALFHKI